MDQMNIRNWSIQINNLEYYSNNKPKLRSNYRHKRNLKNEAYLYGIQIFRAWANEIPSLYFDSREIILLSERISKVLLKRWLHC